MHLELVTIGTELMLGFTVDGNAARIGQAMAGAGIRVTRRTTVDDEGAAIRDAVAGALGRTGAVITTGGLGPTRDDITKKVLAEFMGWPLVFDDAVWDAIVARFAAFGRTPTSSNRSQAEVPSRATVLPNTRGTAPGLWCESDHGLVVMLPGVPSEMAGLLEDEVLPRLAARAHRGPILSHVLRTTGIPESELAERLARIEEGLAPLTLAYLPGVEGVDLRITAWGLPREEAERRFQEVERTCREAIGDRLYGTGARSLAAAVLDLLRTRGLRLVTAESCTGGLVAKRLTDVPGSSAGFLGGIIAYDNGVKVESLGVPEVTITNYGAVSAETARAMAIGALERLRGDLAVSLTGIAGPDGGSEDQPVGTVVIGVADHDRVEEHRLTFLGSREEIRDRAAQAALFLVLRRVGTITASAT